MSLFFAIILFFSHISLLNGLDLPTSQIADDSLLRINLNFLMTETPDRVLRWRSTLQSLPNGERVEVRVEERRDEFMVIFSRELMRGRYDDNSKTSTLRRGTDRFPGWAQGSWMLIRKKEDGAGILIRIFPRSDQGTYIEFRPFSEDKCQMDVLLYGGYAARFLSVPVSFDRLYSMPVNDVLRLIENKFPRRLFDPDPAIYASQRKFIAQVRAHLPGMRYADDGAIDENGNYVFIKDLQPQNRASLGLNCSGFLKWLVDGILRPATGERLSIQEIKAPYGSRGSSFTELWEKNRDTFFGLDWIRNLAAAANGILRSDDYNAIEEFEVRDNFFSSIIIPQNRTFVVHSYPGFLDDAGYGIEGLHSLLYMLAINEPYKFYLAAVNNEIGTPISAANPRGTPRLREYFHVAALIPYFDEYGTFTVTVFESAAETSFNAFKGRYPTHYVNLVKIPVPSVFEP